MNVWKRCALLEGHRPPCAAWEHLPDTALPRNGTRCGSLVEPRVEVWQRALVRRDLVDEDRRRDIVLWSRMAAAQNGYRGRVAFVRLATLGPPAVDLFGLQIYPAKARP